MKNRLFRIPALALALCGLAALYSCGSDDTVTFADPAISLSSTTATAAPGEEVAVTVTVTLDAALDSLVITKLWDGVAQAIQVEKDLPADEFSYVYTVIDEDADYILTLNFLLTDAQGQTASVDLVITVELTPMQLLLKYDWRLSDEIRQATMASDIQTVYTDDVYRFNEDGTYQKSNAGTLDDFNDSWYNYCFYDLNETTMRLLMSRTGAFSEEETDTLNITDITDLLLHADVTYYGLDQLDETYDPVEEYEKQFVAVAKGESYDPYGPGEEDDAGPGATCIEVVFDND